MPRQTQAKQKLETNQPIAAMEHRQLVMVQVKDTHQLAIRTSHDLPLRLPRR